MLFYRKKFLIAVLEAFNSPIQSLKFQKYLFLILNILDKKYYDFIPYKYGCFSFESYNDRRSLIRLNYITDNKKSWILNKNYNFLSEIDPQEKKAILYIKDKYGKLSQKNLLNKIYSNYPYYAINSQIIYKAELTAKTKKDIANNKPHQKEKCLFTIGYEGQSIDKYLNTLVKNNIKTLCDVRKNPLSRKYGFSKQSLKTKTNSLGIEYIHIPELGIKSQSRKNLNKKEDYKNLFSTYKKVLLPSKKDVLKKIIDIINKQKRVALTCFELNPDMCHRHCVSLALKKQKPNLKIKHL